MHRKYQNRFQSDSSFTKPWKIAPSTPTPILRLYTGCRLDESFSKSFAGFQKVKVLKYWGYECPSFPKLCGIPSAHAYEIYFKLWRLSLKRWNWRHSVCFEMLPPPRPKMPFGQLNVAIQIYNICKGRLGSRGGGRGCISERRHQISDKK